MQIDSNPAPEAGATRRNAPNHSKALAYAARSALLACMIGLLAADASEAWRESPVAATLSGPWEHTARTAAARRSDATDTGYLGAAGKPAASAASVHPSPCQAPPANRCRVQSSWQTS